MIKNITSRIKSLVPSNKKGQTLVEYALILAFIAVVAIVVLQALGTQVKSKFSQISSALQSAS
ncbi:MAG: Flp family type IVb pilin [Verrucomicrobiota bacterium]